MNPYGPLPFQQERLEKGKAIDQVERRVIGTILVAPYFLDFCEGLRADDFRAPVRGLLYDVLRATPTEEIDPLLLVVEMERRKESLPREGTGWGAVVSSMLDDPCVDEPLFRRHVAVVIEEAEMRRAAQPVEA